MKLKLRNITILTVLFLSNGCATNNWDHMLNDLDKNSGIITMIQAKEFYNRQQFESNSLELRQLLSEVKKEKVEKPTSEEDFLIIISGEEEYRLSIYKNAIVLNDFVSYTLSDQYRDKLQLYYTEAIYGKDLKQLFRLQKDLEFGHFDYVEYYDEVYSERYDLDLEDAQRILSVVGHEIDKPNDEILLVIDLIGSNAKAKISIRASSITLYYDSQEKSYILS